MFCCLYEYYSDIGLEQSYNCDAQTELFHEISQKPETMVKYLRVIPKLTAISEKQQKRNGSYGG